MNIRTAVFFAISFAAVAAVGQIRPCPAAHAVGTMSNTPTDNTFLSFDFDTAALLQSIDTKQNGGAPSGNVGGIAVNGTLVAAVNYGSSSVSAFRFNGTKCAYALVKTFAVGAQPVSLAFGYGHLYVLSAATVESHAIVSGVIQSVADGSTQLLLHDGSASQIAVLSTHALGITERTGKLETVSLGTKGAISGKPVAVPLPSGALTPTGLAPTTGMNGNWYVAFTKDSQFNYSWASLVRGGKVVTTTQDDVQRGSYGLATDGTMLYLTNQFSRSVSTFTIGGNALTLKNETAGQAFGVPADVSAKGGNSVILWSDGVFAYLVTYALQSDGSLGTINAAQLPEGDTNATGAVLLY